MCFTLAGLGSFLVWIIVIAAIIALLRLLLPFVLGQLGAAGGVIEGAIRIVLWAAVAVLVVWFVVDLIGCLAGGGIGFPFRR